MNPSIVPSAGALVVLNGRQSGARRDLAAPVMFIGRAASCDVRLNVDGIEPFHAVLGVCPGEVTLRDLGSGQGTYVNGQRISAALLRDGDLIDLGPFRFRILLPAALPFAASAAIERGEREAVRVQAAAVAAQQAALDEQEARLAAQADELARRKQDLDFTHVELQRDREDAHAALARERERLDVEQHTARERIAAEEQRLARRAALFDQVKSELQCKEGALTLHEVQVNTQREVDSRLLQDGWQCLQRDQERWRRRRSRESMALRLRQALLVEGERKVVQRRADVAQEQHLWLAQRHQLEAELHGLNSRVLHQRQALERDEAVTRALAVRPVDAEAPSAPVVSGRAVELERLAGELADQRALLVEQWERLVRIQDDWQARRDEAAAELETLGERLAQLDEALARREQAVDAAEARLRQRDEQVEWSRRQAALALARCEAQRQTFETERAELLDRTTRVSEQARAQFATLGELRRKWNRRRQQETATLRTERQAVEQLRLELTRGRQDLEEQAQLLENARRTLAEEALALEDNSEEPAQAGHSFQQRRQEPLRRRWLRLNAAVVRAMRREREALKKDLERLRARQDELASLADRLAQTQAATHERQTALEHREALLVAQQAELEQQERDARQRHVALERRLHALQEESELLARALIPDGEEPAALERAA